MPASAVTLPCHYTKAMHLGQHAGLCRFVQSHTASSKPESHTAPSKPLLRGIRVGGLARQSPCKVTVGSDICRAANTCAAKYHVCGSARQITLQGNGCIEPPRVAPSTCAAQYCCSPNTCAAQHQPGGTHLGGHLGGHVTARAVLLCRPTRVWQGNTVTRHQARPLPLPPSHRRHAARSRKEQDCDGARGQKGDGRRGPRFR